MPRKYLEKNSISVTTFPVFTLYWYYTANFYSSITDKLSVNFWINVIITEKYLQNNKFTDK